MSDLGFTIQHAPADVTTAMMSASARFITLESRLSANRPSRETLRFAILVQWMTVDIAIAASDVPFLYQAPRILNQPSWHPHRSHIRRGVL